MDIKAELITPPPEARRVKIELDLSFKEAKAFRAFLGGLSPSDVERAIAGSSHPAEDVSTARSIEEYLWSKLCGVPGLA